jgi:hypothetical protein
MGNCFFHFTIEDRRSARESKIEIEIEIEVEIEILCHTPLSLEAREALINSQSQIS